MVTGGLQDEEEHKTRKAGVAGLAAGGDRHGGAGRAALHAVAHGVSGGTSGRRGGQRRDGGERHGVRRPGDSHGAGQRRGKADPVHYRADGKPRGIMKQ